MGATATDIRAAFARLNKQMSAASIMTGEVVGVDESAATIDVQPADGGAVYHAIQLRPADADDALGVVAVPAVGAQVICAMTSPHSGVMLFATKVDKYAVRVSDSMTLEGSTDGWVINGGNFGGLIKIEKLVDRLNTLEDRVNKMLVWLQTHVHVSAAPGSPTTPPSLPPDMFAAAPLVPTQQAQLEDKSFTH